jgi:hypothetical protein
MVDLAQGHKGVSDQTSEEPSITNYNIGALPMRLYSSQFRHSYEAYRADFIGKWGCRYWPDSANGTEDQEALTCDTGAFAADANTAINYAKGQMRKELEATEDQPSTVHTVGCYVAPWGDTYSASDLENGYVPSEAIWQEWTVE